MRSPVIVMVVVVALGGSGGCGGSNASPSSTSSTPSADTAKPMAGSALGDAGKLVGRWVCATDCEYDTMEFMKDGKALVGGAEMGFTVDYSVLDGGRLSMLLPMGMTTVYEVTIAGDQIELRGQGQRIGEGAGPQRYRRLKSGETVAQALQAQEQAKAMAHQDRVAALEAFLKQPDLVLAFTESGAGAPPAIALDLAQAGRGPFNGKAWHDDKPPHLDAIASQTVVDQQNNTTQVQFQFGPQIQPTAATPQSAGGQVTLNATGDGKNLRIAGKVTVGQGGATYEMVLRSDPSLHAEIVKHFDAEIARIESLKAPITNLLKEYALLRGQSRSANTQAQPDAARIVLVRDPKSGLYGCEGWSVNGGTGTVESFANAAAAVVVANDKPMLRIVCPPRREYLLQLADGSAGKLAGQWHMPGSPTGMPAQFDIVQALDPQARDQYLEAQRSALAQISTDTVFLGLTNDDVIGWQQSYPVALTLTPGAAGSFTGKVSYPSVSLTTNVIGQVQDSPFGPRLLITCTGVDQAGDKNAQFFSANAQKEVWTLSVTDTNGPLRLIGYWQNAGLGRPVALSQSTDESRAQLREKLTRYLGKDGRFQLLQPLDPNEQTILEFKLDAASNHVTGKPVSGGRLMGARVDMTTFDGELKEQDAWLVLTLKQMASKGHPFDILLLAVEDDGVLHLNGMNRKVAQPVPDHYLDFIAVTQ